MKIKNYITNQVILLGIVLIISACASTEKDITEINATELLQLARSATDAGKYQEALNYYEQIEARYPYTIFSRQALLDQAYNYYQQTEDDKALITIDRFLKLYPNQQGADYANYLKGLIYYGKGRGIIDFLVEATTSKRDIEASKKASESFSTVVNSFPQSPYVEEAKLRLSLLFNQMGQYEVNIARYYLDRGAYVAAIKRANKSIIEYPRSQAQEEALAIIAVAYDNLQLTEFRDQTVAVLKHNYPETEFSSMVKNFWE